MLAVEQRVSEWIGNIQGESDCDMMREGTTGSTTHGHINTSARLIQRPTSIRRS